MSFNGNNHPLIRSLSNTHDEAFSIDKNECICGDSPCDVLITMDKFINASKEFASIRKEYIAALDAFQLRMYKAKEKERALLARLHEFSRKEVGRSRS